MLKPSKFSYIECSLFYSTDFGSKICIYNHKMTQIIRKN